MHQGLAVQSEAQDYVIKAFPASSSWHPAGLSEHKNNLQVLAGAGDSPFHSQVFFGTDAQPLTFQVPGILPSICDAIMKGLIKASCLLNASQVQIE